MRTALVSEVTLSFSRSSADFHSPLVSRIVFSELARSSWPCTCRAYFSWRRAGEELVRGAGGARRARREAQPPAQGGGGAQAELQAGDGNWAGRAWQARAAGRRLRICGSTLCIADAQLRVLRLATRRVQLRAQLLLQKRSRSAQRARQCASYKYHKLSISGVVAERLGRVSAAGRARSSRSWSISFCRWSAVCLVAFSLEAVSFRLQDGGRGERGGAGWGCSLAARSLTPADLAHASFRPTVEQGAPSGHSRRGLGADGGATWAPWTVPLLARPCVQRGRGRKQRRA